MSPDLILIVVAALTLATASGLVVWRWQTNTLRLHSYQVASRSYEQTVADAVRGGRVTFADPTSEHDRQLFGDGIDPTKNDLE
jgi:hypothetical protein